jgi:hypothetical protein
VKELKASPVDAEIATDHGRRTPRLKSTAALASSSRYRMEHRSSLIVSLGTCRADRVQESPAVVVHAIGRPSRRRVLVSSVRRLSQSVFRTGMSDTVIPNFSDRRATRGPVRSISGHVRSKRPRTTATSRSEPWWAVPLEYEPYRIRRDSWRPYNSCSDPVRPPAAAQTPLRRRSPHQPAPLPPGGGGSRRA